ncbi:DUF58 domain-containing protein [Lysinibacillus telephonicus]|uniref:DUF58 domain-containing protein n=1 Tax=Lysinibacillus telephonicus TaxID=1714840 RepID=A0A3S0QQ56_9BACI|nr:DUF58 domain-containing protein [Lysinibacillus telephonicus]RTQ88794.1 DUF58 domain-containing protein [Lysinibacillus telephonicus]
MNKIKGVLGDGGRLVVIILLIVITFSYAMFQGGFVSWFIFYSIAPFLIYSLLLTFAPIQVVEFQREIEPSKLQRDDNARVTVRFKNKTWFPLIFLTVKEMGTLNNEHDQFIELSNQIFFVGWKRKFEWTYNFQNVGRGHLQFSGLKLTFTDFFGWTLRTKFIEEDKTVVVYPRISELKYKPLNMQFEHGGVPSPYTMVKDASLVTGVREYQSGDKYSWIHWKSFAKNETLRTKEFEDRQSQELFLIIDQSSNINFEYSVDLAASILQSVIKSHGDISFLSTGENYQYFQKIKTQNQMEKVMQHLAIVKPDAKKSLDSFLANEIGLNNSATITLITGELSESVERFLVNSTKLTQGIICLVITDQKDKLLESRIKLPTVKVIPISKTNFEKVFTEVMKP